MISEADEKQANVIGKFAYSICNDVEVDACCVELAVSHCQFSIKQIFLFQQKSPPLNNFGRYQQTEPAIHQSKSTRRNLGMYCERE